MCASQSHRRRHSTAAGARMRCRPDAAIPVGHHLDDAFATPLHTAISDVSAWPMDHSKSSQPFRLKPPRALSRPIAVGDPHRCRRRRRAVRYSHSTCIAKFREVFAKFRDFAKSAAAPPVLANSHFREKVREALRKTSRRKFENSEPCFPSFSGTTTTKTSNTSLRSASP